MMKKRLLLIVLVFVIGIATYFLLKENSNFEEMGISSLVDDLNHFNPQFNKSFKWKLLEKQKIDNNEYYYYIWIQDKDTTKTSQVFVNTKKDSLHIVYLDKEFFSNDKLNVIRFQLDTIYYYVEDTVLKKRIFKMGKYQYLARSGKLNTGEFRFYYANKDSLDKVRGDNIGFN